MRKRYGLGKSGVGFGLLSLLALLLLGCKERQMPVQESAEVAGGGSANRESSKGIGYADVLPVFKNRCGMCHNPSSAAPNWQDYNTAYARREKIYQRAIVLKDMPLGMTMPDAERALLAEWIKAGAPLETPGGDSGNPGAPTKPDAPTNPGSPVTPVSPLPSPLPTSTPPVTGGVPGYDDVVRPRIFEKTCSMCHNVTSSVPNWLSYDTAFAKREAIYQRVVVKKDMPMGMAMSDADRKLIADWIEAGAPRTSPATPGPDPTPPSTDPDQPSESPYSYERFVKPLVFQPICGSCHNATTPERNWLSYEVAFAKRARIFKRVVVTREMPPQDAPQGTPSMTDEERRLVEAWYKAGAPR